MEEEHEHGAVDLHHLTTKQKAIGAGLAGVIVLGILAARKRASTSGGQSAATGSDFGPPAVVDRPVYIPVNVPGSAPPPVAGTGGGIPSSGGVGTPSAGGLGTPSSSGIGTPIPVQIPGSGAAASAPAGAAPIITITQGHVTSYSDTVAQLAQHHIVISDNAAISSGAPPAVGYGGGNYYTDGPAAQAGIVANEQKIASDSSFVLSEKDRAAQVIETRKANGLDTSAQVDYVKHLEAVPIPENAANTSARPVLGFGGGDYNTASASVQQGIVQNENKLHQDAAFVASEQARTTQVIAARQADGLDISAQTAYQSHLHDIHATTSGGSTLGTNTVRVAPSPGPSVHQAATNSWAGEKQTDPASYAKHIQDLTAGWSSHMGRDLGLPGAI